jgi:predicted TIM-barrel fold metal-dependent hydrolase
MPVVDVHVHLAPQRLARAVRVALADMYGWQLPWPTDPDEVILDLRTAGTDVMVSQPYAHAPGIAASLNDFGVQLARRHPDVLTMATVHPDDEDRVDLLRAALDAGAVGLKVHCPVQRTLPDDPRMADVYAACEQWGVPVLMHAGHGPDASTPHTGAASFAQLMRRHPSLRVCVAHLGMPETDDFFAIARSYEGVFLDLAAVAGRVDPLPVEEMRGLQDRILWGSDYPNTVAAPRPAYDRLRAMGVEGVLLEAIMWRNAPRFLGRDVLPIQPVELSPA